jgi:hypothetical protein
MLHPAQGIVLMAAFQPLHLTLASNAAFSITFTRWNSF